MRTRFARSAALAIAIIVTASLSGCLGGNPVGSIIKGATGGQVDVGGTSLPDGFPDAVPLIDGEIINGVAIGDENGKVFTVLVKVPDASAIDTIAGQLEATGFTSTGVGGSAGTAAGIAYASEAWGVAVAVADDGASGSVATYIVTPVNN